MDHISKEDGDFDVRYGVNTSGLVRLRGMDTVGENWLAGVDYQGVNEDTLREVIQLLPIDSSSYTFLDLGSGKGRAVLIAAEYRFRAVIGVEFADELVDISVENLRLYRGARRIADVQIVHADAAEYVLGEGPHVVFMYNPFEAPVMGKVVQNLITNFRGQESPGYVVYCNPRLRDLFEESQFAAIAQSSAGDGYIIYAFRTEAAGGSRR